VPKPDPVAFNAPALTKRREAAGLSLAQLAAQTNTSRGYLWEIEQGWKQPGWGLVVRLADALGCPLDAFRA
jgi:transcriptional regulator with XRE-family HTH domain